MTAGPLTGTADRPASTAFDWSLVVVVSVLSGVIAVFGVFFLPTYARSVPVPAVVLVTSAALLVLPRVGHRLTGRMAAALAPVVVWFVVTIGLYLATNALYVGVPVAWRGGWQFYLLVGLGAIAAATSLGLLWSEQVERETAARIGQFSAKRQ